MKRKLIRIGNTQGIIIPKVFLGDHKIGDMIDITIEGIPMGIPSKSTGIPLKRYNKKTIERVRDLRYTKELDINRISDITGLCLADVVEILKLIGLDG